MAPCVWYNKKSNIYFSDFPVIHITKSHEQVLFHILDPFIESL